MPQLQSRDETFKHSYYKKPDKDYSAETYRPGVLYSLSMMSSGSFPIKYDFHKEGCKMQPLAQMQTAYDHFNVKMTTGSANVDSLIDSIQEGQFYLFYGSNKAFLDGLVHGLLVNCVLPVREKHGFESMAMYVNNVDYYQPDKSKILSPEKIAMAAKCAGTEPKIVFKNLFVQIACNQRHQLAVANQVFDFIESRKQDIRWTSLMYSHHHLQHCTLKL
jgi:hypothetical protein